MTRQEKQQIIDSTFHADPDIRKEALLKLCPCSTRTEETDTWDRILEMSKDSTSAIRNVVLHCLADGSPASRRREVVAAIRSLANDDDPAILRKARRIMEEYDRTGRIIE